MSEMRYFLFSLIIVLMLFLGGCGKLVDSLACDCRGEMKETEGKWGKPENISKYDSHDYHSQTWSYYKNGKIFTFTWGKNVKGCCDNSVYTFTPIK